MKKRMVFSAAAFMAFATPALADWQYVKWGATADQVVAASKGEAKLNSGDGKNIVCAFVDQHPVAYVASKQIDGDNYSVIICAGSSGKVSSLVLDAKPAAGSFNRLRAALLGRYGQPIEEGRGEMSHTSWRDPKAKNLIRLLRVMDTARLEYRQAGGSGL